MRRHKSAGVSRQPPQRNGDRRDTRETRRFWVDVAAIIVAAIAAIVLFRQQIVMQGQLDEMQVASAIMRGQLGATKADQRAWLSLDVAPTMLDVSRDRVGGPFISLGITAKNVGKSPAQSVTIMAVTHVPTGPEQGGFLDLTNTNCMRFAMTGFASLLVPGDSRTQNTLVMFTEQQIADAWAKPNQMGRKSFNVLPIICVVYKVVSDDDVHLMSAVTQVEKLTEGHPATFEILGRYGD
jgi:hypothetical protein